MAISRLTGAETALKISALIGPSKTLEVLEAMRIIKGNKSFKESIELIYQSALALYELEETNKEEK